MAKKDDNIVTINFNVWCTQQQKAGNNAQQFAKIRQQVKRRLKGESTPLQKSDIREIKQLGITLIRK